MIRDLSETLRAILDDPSLTTDFPELAAAQILFDRPVEDFNPQQTTINLFLYDVRENMELRSNEPLIERNNGIATIHRPPLRAICSYLVTAWPVGGTEVPLQEHRLLSQVLEVLSRYPTIPTSFLIGKLIGQAPPLPMMTSHADGLKNPAEFWTAIGNKLRASLTVTVTISMQPVVAKTEHMVSVQQIRFGERVSADERAIASDTLMESFRITGHITDQADAPVAGAEVSITETGLSATSDSEGRYILGPMPPGTYNLRVESGLIVKNVSFTLPAPAEEDYGDLNVKLTE